MTTLRTKGCCIASAPDTAGLPVAIPTVRRALRLARRWASLSTGSFLHDDLPIHPRMRRTNVVVDTRLAEGDGLRAAFGQIARIPLALFHRRGRVVQVTDV